LPVQQKVEMNSRSSKKKNAILHFNRENLFDINPYFLRSYEQ
jgi:hypothetical protein